MPKKKLVSYLLLASSLFFMSCAEPTEIEEEPTDEATEEVTTDTETSQEDETDEIETTPLDEVEYTSEVEAQYTTQLNENLLDEHQDRYEEMMDTFHSGTFSFTDPLIHVDPYDRSPLSAMVSFETEEPRQVTVMVEGDTEYTTISHTYDEFKTEHHVPVLGLYPGRENNVNLSVENEAGDTLETTLTINTEKLPSDMFDFTVETADSERMKEGLTFIQPSYYPTAVDSNGDVRWYSPVKTYNQLNRLANGHLLLATLEEEREEYDHLTEMDMLGAVHQSVTIDMENVMDSPPLHHDTIVLPNGNYLALLHDGSENYVEDELAEIDRETGEVVHRVNFKDIFPDEMFEEYTGHNEDVGDWLHINTVVSLEGEEALLLSLRNQDVILKPKFQV